MLQDLLDRLVRPLRRPPLTDGYPDEPLVAAPNTRGLPELDAGRCDVNGACATACPTAAIALGDRAWTLDAGRCVFCGDCARACPNDALHLGPRQELAAFERDALVVTVPLGPRR